MRKHRPKQELSRQTRGALVAAAANTKRARALGEFGKRSGESDENYLRRVNRFWYDTALPAETGALDPLEKMFSSELRRKADQLDEKNRQMYFNEIDRIIEEEFLPMSNEFIEAVEHGNAEKVKAILEAGFPVNFQEPATGQTALHIAAASQAREVVRILLETGQCDLLLRDNRGRLASEMAGVFGEDTAMAEDLRRRERAQGKEQGVKVTRRPAPEN